MFLYLELCYIVAAINALGAALFELLCQPASMYVKFKGFIGRTNANKFLNVQKAAHSTKKKHSAKFVLQEWSTPF